MRWVLKFAKDKTINKICWRGYGSCTCFDWSLSHSIEFYWSGQYHPNQRVTIKLPKDVTCIVLCLFIADAVFVFVAVDVLKASLEEFKDNESGGATAMWKNKVDLLILVQVELIASLSKYTPMFASYPFQRKHVGMFTIPPFNFLVTVFQVKMFQLVIQTTDVTVFPQVEPFRFWSLPSWRWKNPEAVRRSGLRAVDEEILKLLNEVLKVGMLKVDDSSTCTSTELLEKCILYAIRAEYTVDGGGKQPQIL